MKRINKPVIARLLYVICTLLCVICILKFTYTIHIYSCATKNHLEYIKEVENIKAVYNNLWTQYRNNSKEADKKADGNGQQGPSLDVIMKRIKVERDLLSLQMNHMWQLIGKLQCETSGDFTSGDGGWCKIASSENSGHHVTDHGLVRALSTFLKSMSIGSFGDGPGAYKREILKLGEVESFKSYDGAPFSEETSAGRVKYLDLTLPQYKIPVYDFVISLEVAEHIPRLYESTYLDNLCRHAKTGIILSWAVPGQGGLNHVNSRTLAYVSTRMKELGFVLDKQASSTLQKACTLDWLKSNLNVYMRVNFEGMDDSFYWLS